MRAPRALLTAGHPFGWDVEALTMYEHELNGNDGVGFGMHDKVIGWDGKVPVNDDKVMTDGDDPSTSGTC